MGPVLPAWALFYLDWWIRQVHALRLGRQMVDREANTQAHTDREKYTEKNKTQGLWSKWLGMGILLIGWRGKAAEIR